MLRITALLLALCVLGACAGGITNPVTPEALVEPVEASATTGAPIVFDENVPASGLPPQTLQLGECGLFLWSQTDLGRFMFFARAGEEVATMLMSEGPVQLSRVASSGDLFGQFFTRQIFAPDTAGRAVDLLIVPGETMVDGARVSSGRLQVTNADGWTVILPVLGARVCRSAEQLETETVRNESP